MPKTTPDFEPIKLPKETLENLKKLGTSIPQAKQAIASLKKMGIDVRDLEQKMEWAETVRKTLIEDFGE